MSDDVDDAEAGQGEGAGNSSSQEKMVPLSALLAERGKRQPLETQVAELKGTVDTLKQAQQQPKEYTRAELQEAVDAGKVTRDRADQILEDQNTRKVKSEVKAEITNDFQQQERARKIQAEVDRYKTLRPTVMEDGSDDRALVAAEYSRQVSELGKPENLQTELDALTAIFGPASRLQNGTERQAETHQEVGSDGGGEGKPDTGSPPKGLSRDMKTFYEKKIDQGFYKDWVEVSKELEYASPRVKARQGIA